MRQRKRARGRLETHVLVRAAVAGKAGRVVVVVVVVVVFLLSSPFAEFVVRAVAVGGAQTTTTFL